MKEIVICVYHFDLKKRKYSKESKPRPRKKPIKAKRTKGKVSTVPCKKHPWVEGLGLG